MLNGWFFFNFSFYLIKINHLNLFFRYLEVIEEDLESSEDYHVQKTIMERLIHRLVKDDRILIRIDQSEDPCLMVNPNYVLDED